MDAGIKNKQDTLKEPRLAEVIRLLVELYDPLSIWLFGSRARGDHHQDSDYDIFLVVPDDADQDRRNSGRWLAIPYEDRQLPVELHICRREWFEDRLPYGGTLPHEVEEEGCLLYGD